MRAQVRRRTWAFLAYSLWLMAYGWEGDKVEMFRFETLDIWKLAIEYGDQIFEIADQFPQRTQTSLGSQLRGSVLSISNNIAEGSGSDSKPDFRKFLIDLLSINNNIKFSNLNEHKSRKFNVRKERSITILSGQHLKLYRY